MERRSKRTNFVVGLLFGLILGLVVGFALDNVVAFLIAGALISVGFGALIVFDPVKKMYPEDTIFK